MNARRADRTTAVGDATRARLIRAAERLVAERGLDGVSVRDITAAADTNIASIHYHFQSKEGLILAVLEDMANRMRAHRLRHVGTLRMRKRPTARQVAEAIVNPTFELVAGDGEDADRAYVGFLAIALEDPALVVAVEEYFGDQYEAYLDTMRRARPDLAEEVVVNRVCFALHLVLNSVCEPARGLRTWIEHYCPTAIAQVQQDLTDFLAGAFRAP